MTTVSARLHHKTRARKQPFRPEHFVFAVCEAFALYSLLRFSLEGSLENALKSAEAMLLGLLPMLAEHLFRCRIAGWLYVPVMLYTLGPLAGHAYRLFYTTGWCDKAQHTFGGFLFALAGFYLPELLNREHDISLCMRVLFAVCFSIAVSALWEMLEFGSDMLFGGDAQNDTYITAINSYFLGSRPGELGSIAQIESVVVNGVPLEGYIDIGLIDTMMDMIVETLGALAAAVFLAADKSRHPAFRRMDTPREIASPVML